MSETQQQEQARCPKCGGPVIQGSSRDPCTEWEFCENTDCSYAPAPTVITKPQ